MKILNAVKQEALESPPVFSSVQWKQYFDFPLALRHLAASLHTSRQMLSASVRKPSAIATIPSLSLLQAESRKGGMVRLLISNRPIAEAHCQHEAPRDTHGRNFVPKWDLTG
jgi:hypothetical protein